MYREIQFHSVGVRSAALSVMASSSCPPLRCRAHGDPRTEGACTFPPRQQTRFPPPPYSCTTTRTVPPNIGARASCAVPLLADGSLPRAPTRRVESARSAAGAPAPKSLTEDFLRILRSSNSPRNLKEKEWESLGALYLDKSYCRGRAGGPAAAAARSTARGGWVGHGLASAAAVLARAAGHNCPGTCRDCASSDRVPCAP